MLAIPSCSTAYLPFHPIDSPEVLASRPSPPNATKIRATSALELLTISSGLSLTGDAEPTESGTSIPITYLRPGFGARISIDPKWDLGARFSASGPLQLVAKYLFQSEPFIISATVLPGIQLGTVSNGSASSATTNNSQSYIWISGVFSLNGGYRWNNTHLSWLSPVFAFASLSNAPALTTTTTGSTHVVESRSATSFGAAIGHEITADLLLFRAEVAYSKGSNGAASTGGLSFATQLGYLLAPR